MIVPNIVFDKVTIYKKDPNSEESYIGCLVTLREDGSVGIGITGDVSSSWVRGMPIVMSQYDVIELTPWLLTFKANMKEGYKVRGVLVRCEFNMFSSSGVASTTVSRRKCADMVLDDQMISGNRKCKACGKREPLSDYKGDRPWCSRCTEEARKAYVKVMSIIARKGFESRLFLVPSKRIYMMDYLDRKSEQLVGEKDPGSGD